MVPILEHLKILIISFGGKYFLHIILQNMADKAALEAKKVKVQAEIDRQLAFLNQTTDPVLEENIQDNIDNLIAEYKQLKAKIAVLPSIPQKGNPPPPPLPAAGAASTSQ